MLRKSKLNGDCINQKITGWLDISGNNNQPVLAGTRS